jgi:uncharacterized protein YbaR (Trm112 family)
MTVDPGLLEILRCPADQGEVEYRPDDERIVCLVCGNRYGIIEGDIPNMLLEDAERPEKPPGKAKKR